MICNRKTKISEFSLFAHSRVIALSLHQNSVCTRATNLVFGLPEVLQYHIWHTNIQPSVENLRMSFWTDVTISHFFTPDCFPFLCLCHSRQDNQSCRTSDAQPSTESSYLQAVDSQGVPLCLSCQQPCSTTGGEWDTRFCSHRYRNTNYIQLEGKLRAKLDISNL